MLWIMRKFENFNSIYFSMFNGYVKNRTSFPLFVRPGTPHKIQTPAHKETLKVGSFIYSKVKDDKARVIQTLLFVADSTKM
ncbi:hypothetical protein SUGI_0192290 [Cryptomeria japonica]|nr:hypothetical protein SUGI_0192290 [Cryptomeria japonica]